MGLCFSAPAAATIITVNTGNLTHGFGNCTLLDAVNSINLGHLVDGTGCSAAGTFGLADTIVLKNFVFTFSNQTAGGNISGDTAITLTKPVKLIGDQDANARPLATIQRNPSATPFRLIETNSSLTMSGIVVQNGDAGSGYGGGIYVTGHDAVSLSNCTISGNSAGADGGGIYSTPAITITNSTVSGNTAHGSGGGISAAAALTVSASTISSNTAQTSNGGGISDTSDLLTIDGSTISNNRAPQGQGGGIFASTNIVALTNTTVYDNYAQRGGGGLLAYAATLNFCTVSGNTTQSGKPGGGILVQHYSTATATLMFGNDPGNDADAGTSGVVLGGSNNLIHTHGSNISVPADSKSCDPQLASLADNGGTTLTQALPAGSCAINAGPTLPPRDIVNDQRGNHYPRLSGEATDIGAFEVQPVDRIFIDGFEL